MPPWHGCAVRSRSLRSGRARTGVCKPPESTAASPRYCESAGVGPAGFAPHHRGRRRVPARHRLRPGRRLRAGYSARGCHVGGAIGFGRRSARGPGRPRRLDHLRNLGARECSTPLRTNIPMSLKRLPPRRYQAGESASCRVSLSGKVNEKATRSMVCKALERGFRSDRGVS